MKSHAEPQPTEPPADGEQLLMDLAEVRERLSLLHRMLAEERAAEENVKALAQQLARAKTQLKVCRAKCRHACWVETKKAQKGK